MRQERPNIGEVGIKSIRIGGMKIQDLPIAELAHAKQQLPLAIDQQRLNKVRNVVKRYPTQRCDYLRSRITECEENIQRIKGVRGQQQKMIQDYQGHISMCEYRDREVAKLGEMDLPEETLRINVKDLEKRFPPYNVEKMQQQIAQCEEAIVRAEDVVGKEYGSIAEFRELLGKCELRDIQLRNLGVGVAAG